ncbi:ABC transporter ATP-binding protein [Nocardioides mangrovicus]|uniref:ABC transporter ATP-binding protein n=1 Tax=Nocardioides mangrovicus TaxID=2478913 RepID=A0A3L8P1T2_9ACTN|nr:ABC transporter ATP-binding protein [Nocardioides mangrovicus]RLV49114.1 ABC transporter ATP-binding protein [Nocardioides mangrovicus]
MAVAIRTVGLRKVLRAQRGRRVAVDGLDMEVPAGGVHALLGAPGAGRSEVLRLLVGLSRPTAGTIELLGVPVPSRLPEVMPRVGAMVEEPVFTGSFSGRRNLLLLARAAGVGRDRVDAVIERLGLSEAARHHFAGYSVGERQRLALAAALLKDPELLLLDEPTADLDPAGAREVVTMLRERGDAGRTVLLTTDDPALVRQVCDSVHLVDEGRTVAAGSVTDVLGEVRMEMTAVPSELESLLGSRHEGTS